MPLLSVNCHKDTQVFLCSLFAPVCVQHTSIYPCRSLCESVRQSCEGPMRKHSYEWPSMFNCSQFPDDNGLCIKSPDEDVYNEPTTTTPISTTTTELVTMPAESYEIIPSTEQTFTQTDVSSTQSNEPVRNNEICSGCNRKEPSMKEILMNYCNSDIALRARIQSIKISNIDSNINLPLMNRRNGRKSLYLKIMKRDRRIIKGHSLFTNPRQYFSENRARRLRNDFSIYLFSNFHLRVAKRSFTRNMRSKNRQLNWYKRYLPVERHCTCEKLRSDLKRTNVKYFFTANIVRTRNLADFNSQLSQMSNETRTARWAKKSTKQLSFIYLTSAVRWNKARPLIDYLENDSVDPREMCDNIDQSVIEINKAYDKLF